DPVRLPARGLPLHPQALAIPRARARLVPVGRGARRDRPRKPLPRPQEPRGRGPAHPRRDERRGLPRGDAQPGRLRAAVRARQLRARAGGWRARGTRLAPGRETRRSPRDLDAQARHREARDPRRGVHRRSRPGRRGRARRGGAARSGRRRRRRVSVLVVAFLAAQTAAPAPDDSPTRAIDPGVERPGLASALWGVEIRSLRNGRVLYARNAEKNLRPASTLKLVASAAALDAY